MDDFALQSHLSAMSWEPGNVKRGALSPRLLIGAFCKLKACGHRCGWFSRLL
jgi:hypothetical protein